MSIDEAITHCLEVADGQTAQGRCPECAADHRQLAEWLKDYKRLKEQEPKTGYWIDNNNGSISCSYCHTWFYRDDRYSYMHYCPKCGCRMYAPQERSGEE